MHVDGGADLGRESVWDEGWPLGVATPKGRTGGTVSPLAPTVGEIGPSVLLALALDR